MIPDATKLATPGVGFGRLLESHRRRLGLSQNELARRAAIDPAYVNRMESTRSLAPVLPSRRVVEAIAVALDLDENQSDELLVAAGYCPRSVLDVGAWDETLAAVADVLRDPELSFEDRQQFRNVVRVLASRWRGSLDKATA
jgi:transcriptional regulator with XRE-family HTH domain